MKDKRRPPDSWTAVAVHEPDQVAHHHYVTHAKWSPESPHDTHDASQSVAKRGWPVFRNVYRPSLASVLTDQQPLMRSETTTETTETTESTQPPSSEPCIPFTDKYGRCLEILHYGANSTVRLHQNKTTSPGSKSKHLVAVKVYRYNIVNSSNPFATSFHCSPSSLSDLHPHHPNILSMTDLLYNEREELCLVMPLCAGGDLHELVSRAGSSLPKNEADCITAQILRALSFLHEHDTAHRDIRLETILLTEHGAVKLAGFGDGHIRRLWSKCALLTEEDSYRPRSHSHPAPTSTPWSFSLPWLFGSSRPSNVPTRQSDVASPSSTASFPGMSLPYIPPEGFKSRSHTALRDDRAEDEEDNDPRPADIWATAIIYLTLITGRLAWRSARPFQEDPRYLEYIHCRGSEDGYPPIEALGKRRRNAVYAMLHPNPRRRITSAQMLQSEWMSRVSICEAGQMGL